MHAMQSLMTVQSAKKVTILLLFTLQVFIMYIYLCKLTHHFVTLQKIQHNSNMKKKVSPRQKNKMFCFFLLK